jgi:hypothetical protein
LTYVIGIDPGKATGIAVYDLETCKPVHMEETPNGIHGFKMPYQELLQHDDYCNSYTACEGFTLRGSNKFTANLQGVEIIGWLKGEALCAVYPEPSQHMALVKKSVLTGLMKEAGFPIGAGHTRMALSVAVWHAAKFMKHIPTLELLKPKGE